MMTINSVKPYPTISLPNKLSGRREWWVLPILRRPPLKVTSVLVPSVTPVANTRRNNRDATLFYAHTDISVQNLPGTRNSKHQKRKGLRRRAKASRNQFRGPHARHYHVFESYSNAGPMERYAHVEKWPSNQLPRDTHTHTRAPNGGRLC